MISPALNNHYHIRFESHIHSGHLLVQQTPGKMKWKVIYIAWCCKIWFKLTFSLSIDTGKCYVSVCVSLVLQQMNWKSCILLLWEKASTQSCHLALSSSLAMLDRLFWGCLSLLCLNNIGTTSSLTNLQVPKSSLKTSFSHHKNI